MPTKWKASTTRARRARGTRGHCPALAPRDYLERLMRDVFDDPMVPDDVHAAALAANIDFALCEPIERTLRELVRTIIRHDRSLMGPLHDLAWEAQMALDSGPISYRRPIARGPLVLVS